MAWERQSVDDQQCKELYTCPSVWTDDDNPEMADYAVVVGEPVDPASIPGVLVGEGEIVLKVRRQVLRDAEV